MGDMMQANEQRIEYYKRFPAVLKRALIDGKVNLPDNLLKEFQTIIAYRGIRFKKGEKESVEKSDFLSQVERNIPGANYDDIGEYSCSCFENIDELRVSYKLPRKNKGIAKGKIKCENGPIVQDEGTHIHWFLYDNVDPSQDFEVYEYEKMD